MGLIFAFATVQTAPTPVPILDVPVVFDFRLRSSVARLTSDLPAIETASAALTWNLTPLGAENASVAAFCDSDARGCDPGHLLPVGFTELLHTDPGSAYTLGFDVQASASGAGGQTLHFVAGADPELFINPTFRYADDFQVVFSPNLVRSAAVPEPAVSALCALGIPAAQVRRG